MPKRSVELARMREMARSGEARELRIRAGLSLANVARDLGVSPSSVYYWEYGRVPRGKAAVRYAHLLFALEQELGR